MNTEEILALESIEPIKFRIIIGPDRSYPVLKKGKRLLIVLTTTLYSRFIPENEPLWVEDEKGITWRVVNTELGLRKVKK